MALSVIQYPAEVALSQSPMILTVLETGPEITSQSFQYVAELSYWFGDLFNSTTSSVTTYTLEKYPNESGRGIFDFSRIINANFQQSVEENPSQVIFGLTKLYGRWQEANTFVTGSTVITSTGYSLDGYQLFNEKINPDIAANTYGEYPYFPLLTDGPVTQSFVYGTDLLENDGTVALLQPKYINSPPPSQQPNGIAYAYYQSNLGNVSSSLVSSDIPNEMIRQLPVGLGNVGFPSALNSPDLEWFTLQITESDLTPITPTIRFEVKCPTKYDNVRIKWKNRWGAFDWFNFDLVSRKSFQTQTQQYKPQVGTWGGTSLTYNYYDASKQNYATDTIQNMVVNSDYVNEYYNNIFKQLLVSDEIYFVDNTSQDYTFYRPLTIKSSNVQFKTQKVDKLIQYQFEFEYAQGYKLQF